MTPSALTHGVPRRAAFAETHEPLRPPDYNAARRPPSTPRIRELCMRINYAIVARLPSLAEAFANPESAWRAHEGLLHH